MRKQLCDIQEIDQYLHNEMNAGDTLVFNARLVAFPELRGQTASQRRIMKLIKWFARDTMRRQLDGIHTQLMSETIFSSEINNIFP